MRTPTWLSLAVLALLASALVSSGETPPAVTPPAQEAPARALRPDILFLLADDLGWADVGYHGSLIHTPNLNELARSGIRLERFYVMPRCTPTRAALLTGRHPIRYGLQSGNDRTEVAPLALPVGEQTLAQLLRAAGYSTHLVGKWHLGSSRREQLPTARGFEHQYGFHGAFVHHYTHERKGRRDWFRDDRPLEETGYVTDRLVDETLRILRDRQPEQPLFLLLAFGAPHPPHVAPEEFLLPYARLGAERARYAGMISAMDAAIGRIVSAVRASGRERQTLVVFASDNGASVRARALPDRNAPLSGGKFTLYEGGVRVPALVAWPGRIPGGQIVDTPLHMTDWFPTLLHQAGVALPTATPIDGVDLGALLTQGAALEERAILLNAEQGCGGALIAGRWKLRVHDDVRKPGWFPVIAAPEHSRRVELYDVVSDPGESHDLSATEAERVRELVQRYDELSAPMVAALFESPRCPESQERIRTGAPAARATVAPRGPQ